MCRAAVTESLDAAALDRPAARNRQRRAAGRGAAAASSPVDIPVLETVVQETRDATTEELTREYKRRVDRAHRVHRSSILRALHRTGYVFKKNGRGRRAGPRRRPSQRAAFRGGRADRSGATRVCR